MNLSAPQVSGPISVCSNSVRVQGQLTGATVSVVLNGDVGNPVGKGTANSANQVFTLDELPSSGLQPGDTLTAVQILGPDESSESPNPVVVQLFDPVDLNHVNFLSHLYVCGRHLWFTGLAPGATLEVGPGGSRGTARAVDGDARVTINTPLAAGELLPVRQVACGVNGPENLGIEPDPTPSVTATPIELPQPRIMKPIYACDRSALVGEVADGSNVTLFRDAAPPITSGFDRDSLWFNIPDPPFEEGEEVRARQAMPNCDVLDSRQSVPASVLPADQAPAPVVGSPLCANGTAVLVGGLTPGNRVRILQDGAELVVGEAPDSVFAFSVPPLPAGVAITAQEARCDVFGPESNSVTVDDASADPATPEIVENPLHECATAIPVRNLQRGSWVRVVSGRLGQISNTIYVNTTEAAIGVRPALAAGDEVFVEVSACGGSFVASPPVLVQETPDLSPPTIVEPVTAKDTAIVVTDIVPGAVVEVYLDPGRRGPGGGPMAFLKAVNAGLSELTIPVGRLAVGEHLNVRQILCNDVTPLLRDREVEVQVSKPDPPIELSPDGDLEEQTVELSWKDPNESKPDGSADSFDLQVVVNNSTVFDGNVTSNSHVLASPLPFSARVEWRVRGRNASGTSDWSEAAFDVEPEPGPKGPSKLRVNNCHVEKEVLHIWLYDETANSLTEKGTLTHQYNQSGSCPASGSPLDVELTTGHSHYLIAVDPTLIGCGVNDPSFGACQRHISGPYEGDETGPIVPITVS